MRMARSARASLALGATLIATFVSTTSIAANTTRDVAGISGGDVLGISGGDVLGISGGDVLGISGGDVLGISGGDVLGISGGDVLGISGGDVLGISGGDVLGISGGDVLGISGGDVLGISGGDVLGISGGDVLGISGGDVLGISGGDVLGISGGDVLGISGGDVLGTYSGDRLLLAGPVDSVDLTNGVFSSMGQIVMASQEALVGLGAGDFVAVSGSVVGPGWLYADEVAVSDQMYVPGAMDVFVSGILSEVDSARGTARIGNLTIDYTPSLGSAAAPSGIMWSFGGKRPDMNGVMLSETSAAR